jgi:hypothetical protein
LSFTDRIEQLTKDIGAAALAGPKFIWDVASAPWNDAEEFNGFKNTFVNAGADAFSSVIRPLVTLAEIPKVKTALEKWDEINREYIREPLTTTQLMVAQGLNPFENSDWKKAYDQAQTTSFGQASVGLIGALTPGVQDVEKFVDWNNPRSVDEFFSYGPQKVWSGISDTAIQVFGDIAIGVGKAGKAARASELVTNSLTTSSSAERRAKAISETWDAFNGIDNKYSRLAEDFVQNDSLYAFNHPMLKDSTSKDVLASALGQATSKQDALLTIAAGLGDPKALDAIRKIGRSDLANPIAKAQGELDATDKFLIKGDINPDGTFKHVFEDTDVLTEISDEIGSLTTNNSEFAKFWSRQDELDPSGSLARTAGAAPFQAMEKFIAQGRSTKFYDLKPSATPDVKVFQPTPFHRMYQVVSWPAGIRPMGHVNLNDADSSREVIAALDQAVKRGGLSKDTARSLINSYTSAGTPEQRGLLVLDIEKLTVSSLAKKHGLDEEQALKVWNQYNTKRETAMQTLRKFGFINDTDFTTKKVPLLESEFVNSLPMMDFALADNLFKIHSLKSDPWLGKEILGNIIEGGNKTISLLDTMQAMFKVGALLRLGYLVRNSAEAQLRISASVGSLASFRHLGKGVNNLFYNSKNTVMRTIDRFNPNAKDYTFYKNQQMDLSKDIVDIRKQLDSLNAQLENSKALDPDMGGDVDIISSINRIEDVLNGKLNLEKATNSAMVKFETPKQRMGSGSFKYTDVDGKDYFLPDAFNKSTFGDIHWRNSSSESSYIALADSDSRILSRNMVQSGYGAVTPDAPNYWTEWSVALNRKIANSEISRRLAAGENLEQVASWLASKEAKQLRSRMGITAKEAGEIVAQTDSVLKTYAPDDELLRMISTRSQVTPEFLRSKFTDPEMLPTINGNIIEENLSLVGQRKIQQVVRGLFRLIGSMPEDAWARHPFYINIYQKSLKRRLDDFNYLNETRAILPQSADSILSKELQLMMKSAHTDALRATKQVLFTIENRSNVSSLFKFVSPFFSAYENSVKSWAKLAIDKPQIINRGNLIFTAPNRAGIATDANGNLVSTEDATMDDYIWVEVPEGMKKLPFIGKGLEVLTNVGIQKRSLDVIFQGEGLQVPIGPYVAIPISEIVKAQPSYEDALKWAIPFGAERSALTAMLPTWVKRQIVKEAGQSNPQYANTYTLIWQTEQYKRKEQGLPPATPEEVKAMADAYWNMRTVASLVLPFAPQFNSPYKMYIDKWRQYREQFGKDAPAKYWQDYGDDMFQFTMSLSKNNTGTPATTQAVANADKYKDLVADLSVIDPKLIGLVTATGAGAFQFSDAAYKWQLQTPVSEASEMTFRGRNNPQEAIKENNAQLGWIKYREIINYVDSEMEVRGVKSIQDKRVQDLSLFKKDAVSALAKQNRDWYIDYRDTDGSKFIKTRDAFSTILNNKKFMADNGNDPTWKSVRMYLNIQLDVEQELAIRKAQGLPSSITAKANEDLATLLELSANKLKQEDIGFGDLYDRYLSYDPIFDPNIPLAQ